MGWDDVKEFVGQAAPMLGGLLGGPAGGAAGALVSKALGVDNSPDKVSEAIQRDPQAAAKIREAEMTHQREIEALTLSAEKHRMEQETARLSETQKTYRAELAHDGWFKSGWRPMIGWVMAFVFGALIASLVYAIIMEPSKANDIVDSATVIISVMLGVLGVNVSARTRDKQAARGIMEPGILGSIAERIRGGRK